MNGCEYASGTNELLATAVELVGATARWSSEGPMRTRGTLWYGMICRSFVLLERMLRSTLEQLNAIDPELGNTILRSAVSGKSIERLTFGQCLVVVHRLLPKIESSIVAKVQDRAIQPPIFPEIDQAIWREAIIRRNKIAHSGPGFFDSVDFNAGRTWREYRVEEPLESQSLRVWEMCRHLAKSPLILTAIQLLGTPVDRALEKMDFAENIENKRERNWATAGRMAMGFVNEFHANGERGDDIKV